MSCGAQARRAPREARTDPLDRRATERRATERRADDRRSASQVELEAIREAFDREIDAGHPVSFERVARICRTFAQHLVARGGSL